MGSRDARIDAYISKSAEFAKPILRHLRGVIHEGCPKVVETIKWGFPNFTYHGLLCGMAAFKRHCTFSFWRGSLVVGDHARHRDAMGQFGRLTSLADLPSKRVLKSYLRTAIHLNESGVQPEPSAGVRGMDHRGKGKETRERRLALAIAWMNEGKSRNWKYMKR